MKRLTFEGNFCDICMCQGQYRMTSECADGDCSQKKVWERLKEYEDAAEAGRLFVAPVAIGQTVWLLLHDSPQFYPETNGWYMSQGKITQISTVGFQFQDERECDLAIWQRLPGFSAFQFQDERECDSDWILYDEIGDGYYLTEAEVQAAFKAAVEHDC